MLTGNKGEWSEIYTLLKLLGDKTLYVGDADLNKIEDVFYPILKIIRNESHGRYEFEIDKNIVFIRGGKELLKISVVEFTIQALKLFEKIKSSKGNFSAPLTEKFMNSINCKSLKAKSSKKTDINIVIHDKKINQAADLGFSIKSQLGGDSTLFNAGKTTNFIYKITDFYPTESEVKQINNINSKSKIKDRIHEIIKKNGKLKFVSLDNTIFSNNLVMIDSQLPLILSEIIKSYYLHNKSTIKEQTETIGRKNPLQFNMDYNHRYYEYKIKRFLTDIALGMMPSKVWDGKYDATGGYLVVKENGDILCYHIYNKFEFENYLFANTKLETASSTRHQFGTIYKSNGEFYIKLNLQVRFK